MHPLESGGKEPQRAGAWAEKWGFLVKVVPCLPRVIVPDLYTQAEKRVDRVDEVIARIPLVDNGADAERDGAITLQACGPRCFHPNLSTRACNEFTDHERRHARCMLAVGLCVPPWHVTRLSSCRRRLGC